MVADIAQLGIEVNTTGVTKATASLSALGKQAEQVESKTHKLSSSQQKLDNTLGNLGRTFNTLQTAVQGYIALLGINKLVEYADTWKLINARINLVTDSTEEFAAVQAELFRISQETRTELNATAALYTRLGRLTDELGRSQADMLRVTELAQKAIRVSGATSAEASAGVVQLGQALASGRLQGDELRSILENMPRLAEAIAAGMGVTIGKLRELGKEGSLTAGVVIDALLSQGKVLDDEFSQLPLTVDQSLTQMKNAFMRWLGTVDESTGLTQGLSSAISFLAMNFDTLMNVIAIVATLILTSLVPAIASSLVGAIATAYTAVQGFFALLLANPFVLLATLIAGAVAWLVTFGDQMTVLQGDTATYFDYVIAGWQGLTEVVSNVVTGIQAGWEALLGVLGAIANEIVRFFTEAWSKVVETFNKTLDYLKQKFAAFMDFIGVEMATVDAALAPLKTVGGEIGKGFDAAQKSLEDVGRGASVVGGAIADTATNIGSKWRDAANEIAKTRHAASGKTTGIDLSILGETPLGATGVSTGTTELDKVKTKSNETRKLVEQQWKQTGDTLSDSLGRAIGDAFETGRFSFDSFFENVRNELARNAASNIGKSFGQLGNTLFGGMGASTGMAGAGAGMFGSAIGAAFSGMFGQGAFADGGNFVGGKAMLVGERGPEVIVPRTGGTVIPNGGGSAAPVINMNISTPDVAGFRQYASKGQIAADMASSLRRLGARNS